MSDKVPNNLRGDVRSKLTLWEGINVQASQEQVRIGHSQGTSLSEIRVKPCQASATNKDKRGDTRQGKLTGSTPDPDERQPTRARPQTSRYLRILI
jgi:hypothetical protein